MINQCSYIRRERGETEQKIVNGVACLRTAVNMYNELFDYMNDQGLKMIELYNRIKKHKKGNKCPIAIYEIDDFREILSNPRKDIFDELGEAKEECGWELRNTKKA